MHYLIDLDNTLLDAYFYDKSGKVCFYWTRDFEADFGAPVAVLDDLFRDEFLTTIQNTIELHDVIAPWIQRNKLNTTVTDFLAYWLSRDAILNSSVWDWIKTKKAAGHHFHIASNQPHVRMDYLWRHFSEWPVVFDEVFTSARIKLAKPDIAFFQYAQQKLNVPFHDMCLIDDSAPNIKSAQSLGMNAILFTGAQDLK